MGGGSSNCFHKCGFRKEHPNVQVLDQEEEEFANLVKELSSDVSSSDCIDFDMDVATTRSPADVESTAWRQESRQEAIKLIVTSEYSQENEDPMEIVSDEEYEEIIDPMTKK